MLRVLITNLVFVLGLAVTLAVTVDFASLSSAPWKYILIGLLLVAAGILFFMDVRGAVKAAITKYGPKNQADKIRRYMTALISNSGSCVVFSRDLTWAIDDAAVALREHARSGSLTLVMPKANALSKELGKLGAKVHYYPSLDYVVQTRFTIVNAETRSAAIAIGRNYKGDHYIELVTGTEHAGFMLAQDLYNVIKKMQV